MDKIRWGVLSTARIALKKVIPAMQQGKHSAVVAIASRSQAAADEAKEALNLEKAFGSYEALLDDREIDAVYIPLPNHLHVPWSLKALEAGKHVLCEKPIGLTSQEAETLLEASSRHPELKVMEAFMYRHHPQWVTAKRLADEGTLGTLTAIQSFFSYFNDDPQDIRNQPEIGGGGLMDIGCYPISLSRFIFGREPERVSGQVEYDPRLHIDRRASAVMDFGGQVSTFTCGTQTAPYQRVNIFGTEGRVEIDIPFNAPSDRACRLFHQSNDGIEEIRCEVCDQYTIQGDLFSRAVLDDTTVPTPLADAVDNMRVIEAVIRSAKSGNWEAP